MLDSILFYFFAGVAVLSAALMITRRNVMHSAVFLVTTLLATAGIFLQLRAEFLFVTQIIVYVGGIMVLFIFVIMLVRLDVATPQMRFRLQKFVAVLVAVCSGLEVIVILHSAGQIARRWLVRSRQRDCRQAASQLRGTGKKPVQQLPAALRNRQRAFAGRHGRRSRDGQEQKKD